MALVTLALLGAGCRLAEPWREPSAPKLGGSLGDGGVPDPRASKPLTLAELLAWAEVHAPLLRVAQAEAERGNAEVDAASPLIPYNPEVAGTVGGRTIAGVTRLEVGAEIEQRFEIAGQQAARMEAAEAAREASHAGVRAKRWELHARVHTLYHELLLRGAQRRVAEELVAFAGALEAIVQKRIDAGEESPLRAIVAKAEIAEARQIAIVAQRAERGAELELAALVGWPNGVRLAVAGALPATRPAPALPGLLAASRKHHPAIERLALTARAADARVDAENRDAWPDPAIGFGYAREADPDAVQHVWLGTLRLPLPIWERNQGGRARARAERSVARAEQEALSTTLGTELARAANAVDAAHARVEVYGGNLLPAFQENLAKLRRAFELGEIDILELSQIRERLLDTQRAALEALGDYYRAAGSLETLSGVELFQKRGPP